jgi:hypothetical protein
VNQKWAKYQVVDNSRATTPTWNGWKYHTETFNKDYIYLIEPCYYYHYYDDSQSPSGWVADGSSSKPTDRTVDHVGKVLHIVVNNSTLTEYVW